MEQKFIEATYIWCCHKSKVN